MTDLYKYADELIAAIAITAGLVLAKPVINWMLIKLYNLFIGTDHY